MYIFKGRFTAKSKIHIFPLTFSAIYQSSFGVSCLVLEISAVEISASALHYIREKAEMSISPNIFNMKLKTEAVFDHFTH